ncbi:MAG: DUF5723 family protein [Chitinophagales bacterium]
MRKMYMIALLTGLIANIYAQDSTAKDIRTSSIDAIGARYVLQGPLVTFNYTGYGLNNYFSEEFYPGTTNRITADFDYYTNSNSIPGSIVYKMIFKGEIKTPLKDRGLKGIKKQARFEDNMKTGVTYRHFFKNWDGIVLVGWHHREMRTINLSKDAYHLLFYGNADFEDKTADLSNLYFSNNIYNQLSLGIFKKVSYAKYQMEFGFSGSFLQGINHQEIRTRNATIYTAPDGEYIDINYDLTFNNAREGATSFSQVNGAGASGDFHLAVGNNNKWKVAFDLSDVGYMTFRKTPVNYTAAKNVHFQGIVLPDLLTFSPATFDTLKVDDAVKSNLPTKSNNKYSIFLPFTAQLVYSMPVHRKVVLSVGAMYRYQPNYYLYGYAKVNYFITPTMVFSGSLGAGGYSKANLGVEFSKTWKYFDITVGTSNLLGLVAPAYLPGAALFLRLGSSF